MVGRRAGREGPFEPGELGLQVIQLRASSGDVHPPPSDAHDELLGHAIAVATDAHRGQPTALVWLQAKTAQCDHDPDSTDIVVGVLAVAVLGASRQRQDALGLVEADGLRGRPGVIVDSVHLQVRHGTPPSHWKVKVRGSPAATEPDGGPRSSPRLECRATWRPPLPSPTSSSTRGRAVTSATTPGPPSSRSSKTAPLAVSPWPD